MRHIDYNRAMRSHVLSALVVPVLVIVGGAGVGCGAEPTTPPAKKVAAPPVFPKDALLSTLSTSGALHIEVRTDPQPPAVGVTSVQYVVDDDQGAGVEHLDLTVVPWMPAMGHGASVKPTATEIGGGVYRVDEVDLIMPGSWELRTHFTGAVTDDATPAFDVQ